MTTVTITHSSAQDHQYGRRLKRADSGIYLPEVQSQLLLHAARQPYSVEHGSKIPELQNSDELLVEIHAIGLNPIDWKSADYGFGIPALPCLNGREFVGKVVARHDDHTSSVQVGDLVLAVSTDYRDYRKSAFQEYSIASSFNAIKLPSRIDAPYAAAFGVASVTASIALGVSLGVRFPAVNGSGPLDLLSIAQSQAQEQVPEDVAGEVFDAVSPANRPQKGDWILVNGASSITGQISIQLAKLVGLKVVAVVDTAKHGERIASLEPDLIIDRKDLDRAAKEIRQKTPGSLRFAIDTVGSTTAAWCQDVLASRVLERFSRSPSQSENVPEQSPRRSSLAHLVGLTGLPKTHNATVRGHKLPIKLFHTNPALGRALSDWLYELLSAGLIQLPEAELVDGGLGAVNASLDRMRRGEISGKRLVVRLK